MARGRVCNYIYGLRPSPATAPNPSSCPAVQPGAACLVLNYMASHCSYEHSYMSFSFRSPLSVCLSNMCIAACPCQGSLVINCLSIKSFGCAFNELFSGRETDDTERQRGRFRGFGTGRSARAAGGTAQIMRIIMMVMIAHTQCSSSGGNH